MNATPKRWVRWLVAVAGFLLAAAGTGVLSPTLTDTPYALFICTTALVAWYGGFGPGLLVGILTTLLLLLTRDNPSFIYAGRTDFSITHPFSFLAVGLVVTAMTGLIRRDIERRQDREAQIRQLNTELETRASTAEEGLREISLLQEIGKAMLDIAGTSALADRLLMTAMQVGSYDIGLLRLARADGLLEVVAARGYHDDANLPPVAEPGALNLAQGSGTVIFEDLSTQPAYVRFRAEGVASLALVPILARDEPLGLFAVGTRTPHKFDQREIAMLETIGSQTGLALQRTRLNEEIRKAYEELQRTEQTRQRLAAILEATSDLVAIADADGTRFYLNPAGRRLLGFDEHDDISIGRLDEDRPTWARTQFVNEVLPTLERAGIWTGESAYLNRHGQEIPVLKVTIAHRNADGELEYYSSIARDITGLKQLEERLLRGQRLETAGRVAAQVAHDFNNLLGPLVGFPDIIKAELPEGHRAAQFCDVMLQAAQQMAKLNEDLLALGRRGHFEPQTVNLNELVVQAIEQTPLPETITIEQQLDPDLMAVSGSPAQLVRLMTNLITNAREAMRDQGAVQVCTDNVYQDQTRLTSTGSLPVGSYVRLRVADSGGGIPDDVRERMFDPFFTTKQGTLRRGAGLGLSVVQAVVDDHGGGIDVESVLDRGTAFLVYLPVSQNPAETAPPEEEPLGGDENILIVDDDPFQRVVSHEILQSLGYQVSVARSGEEALVQIAKEPVDLVILDMVMPPGIDGAETYQRVLELSPNQRAILVSGFAESDRVQLAQHLGAGDFLRKPVTRQKLAVAVRGELDRSAASNGHGSR